MKDKQIIIYTANDGTAELKILIGEDTIWATQKDMSELFGTQVPAIAKHIKNILRDRELVDSTISKMEIVQKRRRS